VKRKKLLNLLHSYLPTYPEEIFYKEKLIEFVEAHENCFERSLEVGHITGSSWLLNWNRSKALLLLHAKLNIWVQPGGHCDGESDVLQVALKEAREESGIDEIVPVMEEIFDLDIHDSPAMGSLNKHVHYDVRFLLQCTSDRDPVLNHEVKALKWVRIEEAVFHQKPSLARMFHKWSNHV